MKRGTYIKLLALSTGLITIPLFNVISLAQYNHLGEGGDITITSPEFQTYKVFLPDETGTSYVDSKLAIKSNELISDQLKDVPSVISNYTFTQNIFKESSLTNKYESLETFPTGDIYLEYLGYFVKGSEDTTSKQLEYNIETKKYSVESIFKGYDILGYKKIATKPEVEIESYKNLGHNDGIYDVSIFENKVIANRAIYFKPNNEKCWTDANAKFAIEGINNGSPNERFLPVSDDGITYKFLLPAWYKTIKFRRMDPNGVNTIPNGPAWNSSGDINLYENGYSSINSKFIQNNWWNDWTAGNGGGTWAAI